MVYTSSNLTNKYNPQEPTKVVFPKSARSNLTNKYNPQELADKSLDMNVRSNLTNKYNPQERVVAAGIAIAVQILPINTILKNNTRS